MPAPEIIHQLVAQFTHNREAYRSGKYNEAQLRQEFLNPFFEALGWDMVNRSGYAPQNREVIHEDSIDVEGGSRAPDYCFRLGQTRKFFVEAKKPAVDIQYDIHPAYQLRRYAWNVQLPLSILTDFEELAVYDCRNKPNPTDSAATARVMFLKYTQYVEKWDELAAIFSREAVWKGSFDQYAADKTAKKGTTEVDDEFLKDIEEWRLKLARNIALRNPQVVNERQLNYAVQMTIDRLIFLRICEDRGIEPENQLREICKSAGIYASLVNLFQRADLKYNSGLFHFKAEKDETSAADSFTPTLVIDDPILKDIVKSMYYPCPYIFKEIPVEILGQVYEQFLGKVIRLTAGHQAKVEEKPEVRKAGGVYYTPKYIVDYIVAHTVGRLLEGKTPESASQLKIVDPACGSGSFLLGAFQHLLDWHLAYYSAHEPEKWAKGKKPALTPAEGGGWKLTSAEKKRILVNNLHGVDLDAQAVEVTKLSLLLKVLEEESGQMSLGLERVLPDLGRNIQCGNSLIGWDYFEGQLVPDDKDVERVNPFDWQRAFAQVFARGGFDAVIGNPPYVRQESLGDDKKYYQAHYQVYHGMADLYAYFIERGFSLLRQDGLFGYIVANKWMRANYGEPLRRWLKQQRIVEIADFGDLPVFEQATTYPCIIVLRQAAPGEMIEVTQVQSLDFTDLNAYQIEQHYPLAASSLQDGGWSLARPDVAALLEKLHAVGQPLIEYVDGKFYYGIKTGLNEAFVIDAETRERLIAADPRSAEVIVPFLLGREIKRYLTPVSQRYLIFTRRGIDIKKYPAIKAYLEQFKSRLMPRPKNWSNGEWPGRKPGAYPWYEVQDPIDYFAEFEKAKIIIPAIVQNASYAYDRNGIYSNDKTSIIPTNDLYLVGVLNSKVSDFVIHKIASTKQGGYYEYKPMYVSQIPIRTIDFNNPEDVQKHARMVALVERMLELHRRSALTPQEQDRLAQQMAATDAQIDRLVYDLYGLTEDEIRVVEGT